MTIEVGSVVVVTCDEDTLRGQGCSSKIIPGEEYVVDKADGGHYSLAIDCFASWITVDCVELADQYTDEDWV